MFLTIWQNSQENTCARVSFLIKIQALACNLIKNETLAQTLSCEFREIFKNNFFTENLRTTAFVMTSFWKKLKVHQLVTLILMISREQGYEKKFWKQKCMENIKNRGIIISQIVQPILTRRFCFRAHTTFSCRHLNRVAVWAASQKRHWRILFQGKTHFMYVTKYHGMYFLWSEILPSSYQKC